MDLNDKQRSAIHVAVMQDDREMIELLARAKGFNVNIPDAEGQTPVFFAVGKKNLELMIYLEKLGANLEHREMLLRTPLYFAASMGCTEIIKYLIAKGCDVNVCSNLGRTALAKACWNGEPEVVRLLLENHSIDIDYQDSNNRTALHNCVWGKYGGRLK